MDIKVESEELGILYFKTGEIADKFFTDRLLGEKETVEEEIRLTLKKFQHFLQELFLMKTEATKKHCEMLRESIDEINRPSLLDVVLKTSLEDWLQDS